MLGLGPEETLVSRLDLYYAGWKILTTFECVNAEEMRGNEGNAHRARIHTPVVVYYVVKLVNPSKQLSHRGRRDHTNNVLFINDISTLSVW